MKYAFLFGSNVFVVPGNTISYVDNEQTTRFLRIVSVHKDDPEGEKRSVLTIDADIKDNEGHVLHITNNKSDDITHFLIHETYNQLQVSKQNGSTVLDVHQLDYKTAMSLEANIVAELEVNMPLNVIRIRGNFMAGGLHIEIDNEKLFIDDDSYATAALAGETDLKFSHSGVLI
ncbi:MAG TPA: hypothetical protein VG367_06500 [Mucilaginibacter sp.]|nr:hypothetical protein [Mucilaginibacter sp.]